MPGVCSATSARTTAIARPAGLASLTGSLDLTKGGLSNIGFDKAGITLKFWSDGDWYFEAGLGLSFNGWRAYGDILLGNTKDLAPLQTLDPVVADFLGGIPSFTGGYARVGASGRIFDLGCLFNIGVGFEVGGWYINDGLGIKFRGFLTGQAVCLLTIRGDITILGGEVGDKFKMQGAMWVDGGIGFCDPDEWDTPADVLDDGACLSCVLSGTVTGVSPPKLKLSMDGPDVAKPAFLPYQNYGAALALGWLDETVVFGETYVYEVWGADGLGYAIDARVDVSERVLGDGGHQIARQPVGGPVTQELRVLG